MMNQFTTLLFLLSFAFIVSCSDDKVADNNNNTTLPDAVFTLNVSGAENHTFNFTLPKNVASDYAINGSLIKSQNLFSLIVFPLPMTWRFSLVADISSLETGDYNLKPDLGDFINPSQTFSYFATSGTVTITKATLYQSVSTIQDWFIDGTFTGTYKDNSTPPAVITVSGSFSGVNIKVQ